MNIVEELVKEKIATNLFHASNMLNVLRCGNLKTDEERLDRCRLYHAWKMAGENKVESRLNAIAGKPAPEELLGGQLRLVRVYDESEVEEVALGAYQVKRTTAERDGE